MIRKTTFLVGAAAGYVLGARAGRERYEQIVSKAQELWGNPQVQAKVNDLEEGAGTAASTLPERLGGVVSTAKQKVADVRGKGESGSDDNRPTEGAGDLSVTVGAESQSTTGGPVGGW